MTGKPRRFMVSVTPTVPDDAFTWAAVQAIAQHCNRTVTTLRYTFASASDALRFAEALERRLNGTAEVSTQTRS